MLTVALFAASAAVHAVPGGDGDGDDNDHGHGRNTLRVPQDYPTISAAIAAADAGDRIKVANGIYREQLLIDKPLEIEGTNPEFTIIDGAASDLPSLGQVRIVAAGDVEFSKFTIIDPGSSPVTVDDVEYRFHTAIYTESPVADAIYEVHHTRMLRAGAGQSGEGYGVCSFGGLEHLHLHDCLIAEQAHCAVYTIDHAGPMTIEDNWLFLGTVGADVCYVDASQQMIDTPQRIHGNRIDMETPYSDFGFPTAVSVGGYGSNGGAAGFSDVAISGNLIENINENRRGIAIYCPPGLTVRGCSIVNNELVGHGGYTGITIWGQCEDALIAHNLITGINGLAIGTPGTNGGIRLRTFGPGLSPVGTRIKNNTIEALRGISVEGDSSASLIKKNRVTAEGPAAVELGAATSSNTVIRNDLQSSAGHGNDAVVDSGTDNVVRWNH
jgi:hypothetical protein